MADFDGSGGGGLTSVARSAMMSTSSGVSVMGACANLPFYSDEEKGKSRDWNLKE
jgi:hypothetical protein